MEKKYLLSGGISIDNIDDLSGLELSKVHALDVNSKFEISPGLKNVTMLEELKEKIEGFNNEKIITK